MNVVGAVLFDKPAFQDKNMRYQGRIANWNDAKGFGFVTPNGGGERAFVHIKSFASNRRRPVEGDLITYDVTTDPQRGLRAGNVRFAGEQKKVSPGTSGFVPMGSAFAVAFSLLVVASSLLGKLPLVVPFVYVVMSAITFIAYAFDKSAALNNRWRTQESTLHFFALVGGWPGALLAQKIFRHKSKKKEFQAVFWITVLMNSVALAWAFTASGTSFLGGVAGSL